MHADMGLSSVVLLPILLNERCRRQVTKLGLPPLAIVKQLDVLGDLLPGLFACGKPAGVDQLVLHRALEAFDRRIVITISAQAH